MKKPLNAFRGLRSQNLLRGLSIFCIVIIVVAGGLWLSLPANHAWLTGLFASSRPAAKPSPAATGAEAGLDGAPVVNADLKVRPIAADDHVLGEMGAPVQVIVYEDFQCPFCARFYDALEAARKEYGGRIVVAIRHYPLVNHDLAVMAANAAECAAVQGKYEAAYHALFAANKANAFSQAFLSGLGAQLKLDEGVFADCLTKQPYTDKILAEKDEVKKLGVIGTPATFVNGEYLSGAVPYEDFTFPDGAKGEGLKTVIEKKLKK